MCHVIVSSHMISQQRTGIRWSLCSSFEDIIYVDDLALPSHTRKLTTEKNKQPTETSQFHLYLSQCKKDKSINKQQPDTATYRDQQVHLPGQHYQSPRRCRQRQYLQIYSYYGDPQYTPKRPNSESTRAMSSLCTSTAQSAGV